VPGLMGNSTRPSIGSDGNLSALQPGFARPGQRACEPILGAWQASLKHEPGFNDAASLFAILAKGAERVARRKATRVDNGEV
jgi:hypothetical protein